jgi:lipopolysaccharide/colanic/teichoic acid biosynthesis glycosyltransferase
MAFQSTYAGPCAERAQDSVTWKVLGWAERLGAVLLLLVLSPVLCITALVILVLSRRTPLVAHERIGQFGRPFWTLKLRTMWPTRVRPQKWLIERVTEEPGPEIKAEADPRVTSGFARWCRRASIDELPQLIHVARGEMSLVGPRPLTRDELRKHYGVAAPEVLSVRPGITGLWQVLGRSRLSYPQRRRLDLILVRKQSPRLYLEIVRRTLPAVLTGRNAW